MAQRTLLSFFGDKSKSEKTKRKKEEADGNEQNEKHKTVKTDVDVEKGIQKKSGKKEEREPRPNFEQEQEEQEQPNFENLECKKQPDPSDVTEEQENRQARKRLFQGGIAVEKVSKKVKTEQLTLSPLKEDKEFDDDDTEEEIEEEINLKVTTKRFDPVKTAKWKAGEKVPYLVLAKTFEEIESITSRLKIIEILTNLFRSIIVLSPSDLLPCVYLTTNTLAPAFVGLELGIGDALLKKAVADATGRTVASITAAYEAQGDLGVVAKDSRLTQKTMFAPPKLTLEGVYKTLRQIASEQGHASMNKKKDKIKHLLVSCRECEAQYIIRSLQGKLRIGLAEKSILVALSRAFVLTSPDANRMSEKTLQEKLAAAAANLRTAYSELPSYDVIVPTLLEVGFERLLERCRLTVGIPTHPMLAHPTKGIHEVLDRFTDMNFTCEFKYDGERAQIHCLDDGTIKVYSRNLEDNTAKYPDIIRNIGKAVKASEVKSYVLDCEAVAWDPVHKKILPFQVLSTRARKLVKLEDIKVPVCLYAFDLLFIDGKSLLAEPLEKRRQVLWDNFQEIIGEFQFAKYLDTSDTNDIETFLGEAVANQCEGLMIKTLQKEATYQPAKRSFNWLKVKKDYLSGLTDSLDLVPIGAFYGKGKRTGVYGAYLLACYDDENEEYQTICKIGTGFSDKALEEHASYFREHVIHGPRPYYRFGDSPSSTPDVWFDATQVWEVLAADLSISPHYQAAVGMIDPSKGISLRFPRFIRIRQDKKPEDATTASIVCTMYRKQTIHSKPTKTNDDDF